MKRSEGIERLPLEVRGTVVVRSIVREKQRNRLTRSRTFATGRSAAGGSRNHSTLEALLL